VDTRTPADVRSAFLAVNNAEQAASTERSKAQSHRDETTRTAAGRARAVVNSGLMSSTSLVAQVAAEAQAFADQLPAYQANPELFKQRLLAATMERVLTNANVKFTLPDQFDELRLQLSREPEKIESKETP
jgi:membrane protease subunit HflK